MTDIAATLIAGGTCLIAGFACGAAARSSRMRAALRRAEEGRRAAEDALAAADAARDEERAAAALAERERVAAWRSTTLKDARNQLKAVEASSFKTRALLNRAEFRAYRVLCGWLRAEQRGGRHRGFGIFPQVCLGEVLSSPDEDAFASINAKRCDLLVTGPGGFPMATVEYQGEGHDQGDAKDRDAVKRAALSRAAVSMVEIYPGDDDAVLVAKVETGIAEAKRVRAERKRAYAAARSTR